METYYQQTGRAGRDGLPAHCVLIWSRQDIAKNAYLLNNNNNSGSSGGSGGNGINFSQGPRPGTTTSDNPMNATEVSGRILEYAKGDKGCRRRYILQYFQEECSDLVPHIDCCDICEESLLKKDIGHMSNYYEDVSIDVSKEVYMLLSMVSDTGGFFGLTVPISLLLGRNDKSLQRVPMYSSLEFYNCGAKHSMDWWKALSLQLAEVDGLLTSTIVRSGQFSYQKYEVSEIGRAYLNGNGFNKDLNAYFDTKRIPFSAELHSIQCQFSREFLKVHFAELRAKTMVNPKLPAPQSGCGRSVSGIKTRPTSTEKTDGLRRVELEIVIRRVRNELAAASKISPYTVMTTSEIEMVASRCAGNAKSMPWTLQQFIDELHWAEWKHQYALSIYQAIAREIGTSTCSEAAGHSFEGTHQDLEARRHTQIDSETASKENHIGHLEDDVPADDFDKPLKRSLSEIYCPNYDNRDPTTAVEQRESAGNSAEPKPSNDNDNASSVLDFMLDEAEHKQEQYVADNSTGLGGGELVKTKSVNCIAGFKAAKKRSLLASFQGAQTKKKL